MAMSLRLCLELCAALESLDDHVTPLVVSAPPPVVDLTSRAVVSVKLSDTAIDDLNKAVSNIIQKRKCVYTKLRWGTSTW